MLVKIKQNHKKTSILGHKIFKSINFDQTQCRGLRHKEIHTFSLENTRKYQEIPVKFRKY
jgi:hypothetical protein